MLMERSLTYPAQIDVCLVCMPAANLWMPSIALSLLKAHLTAGGIKSFVDYENMYFGRKIGTDFYWTISNAKTDLLLTEYIFAKAAQDNLKHSLADYVDFMEKHLSMQAKLDKNATYKALEQTIDKIDEFLDEAAERILSMQPKIVAFSMMFQQNNATIALARRLKAKAPEVVIMVGGANCMTSAGLALFEYVKEFDYVFFGEADEIFAEVCAAVLKKKYVPSKELPYGVLGRDFDRTQIKPMHRITRDMNALPYPDFHEFFESYKAVFPDYKPGIPVLMVEGSRGCWWGAKNPCTFCGLNGMGRVYRDKSTKRLAEELEYFAETYPEIKNCSFTDSILSRTHLKELPKMLGSKARKLRYFTEIKSNLSEEDIKALKSIGFLQIQPGIESIQDDELEIMHKGCRAIKQIEMMQNCRKHGISVIWNLLCGFPEEKEEYLAEIAELIPKITYLKPPNYLIHIRFQKYSVYTINADRYGLKLRPTRVYDYVYGANRDFIERFAYNFDPVDEQEYYLYNHYAEKGKAYADVLHWVEKWLTIFHRQDLADRLDVTIKKDKVEIIDLRSASKKMIHELKGFCAEVYRECFTAKKCADLSKKFSVHGEENLQAALDQLCDDNLMINMRDEYLSLGIVGGV